MAVIADARRSEDSFPKRLCRAHCAMVLIPVHLPSFSLLNNLRNRRTRFPPHTFPRNELDGRLAKRHGRLESFCLIPIPLRSQAFLGFARGAGLGGQSV